MGRRGKRVNVGDDPVCRSWDMVDVEGYRFDCREGKRGRDVVDVVSMHAY